MPNRTPRSNCLFWPACLIGALVLLLCGWLVPIHLRAVDQAVIQLAGGNKPGELVNFSSTNQPATLVLIRRANRVAALAQLADSNLPVARELLRCRLLTNTVLFPPSSSAAGQAFDAAVAICGLLAQNGDATNGLAEVMLDRATQANRGGASQPIEEILMDEMSLGERFDWPQLAAFNQRIADANTLAALAAAARTAGNQLPVLYAAVVSSQKPAAVARYLSNFSETGLNDLAASERFGAGGVDELLRRDQRLYSSPLVENVSSRVPFSDFFRAATGCALRGPGWAFALKWFFYLSAGWVIALAVRPAGGAWLRDLLFAGCVLLTTLLVTEPFLDAGHQPANIPFRLRLPSAGAAVTQANPVKVSLMNTPDMTASLLTLLLFFILQALIYAACLARLKQTLRHNAPARVKLKLLENEEHLFDAGLYLGFVGTIICLILVSLGVLQFSLMAAYSSTSFGIIFVSILKIFKVRPARRQLLLQTEEEAAVAPERPAARTAASTLVTAP